MHKVCFLEIDIVPANEYNIKIEVFGIDFLDIENLRGNGIMERLLSTKEISQKWGISSRRIARLCSEGRIADVQGERAEYGKQLLKYLSEQLTKEFGAGFNERNLRNMRQFYLTFPIRNTLCAELSWSHYRLLMRIENQGQREFYLKECAECGWSVRQLERQINSFFYERLLATQSEQREVPVQMHPGTA